MSRRRITRDRAAYLLRQAELTRQAHPISAYYDTARQMSISPAVLDAVERAQLSEIHGR